MSRIFTFSAPDDLALELTTAFTAQKGNNLSRFLVSCIDRERLQAIAAGAPVAVRRLGADLAEAVQIAAVYGPGCVNAPGHINKPAVRKLLVRAGLLSSVLGTPHGFRYMPTPPPGFRPTKAKDAASRAAIAAWKNYDAAVAVWKAEIEALCGPFPEWLASVVTAWAV